MATYNLIQTATVGAGGSSSITFNSIPQNYTDLKLVFSLRSSVSNSDVDIVRIAVNGDSTSFIFRNLAYEATTTRSYTQAAYTPIVNFMGYIDGNLTTSSVFGNGECYFTNYSSTTINKTISHDTIQENVGTNGWIWLGTSLYQSNTAISSLTLSLQSNTFVQHSSASLYGIKNS